MIFLLTLTFAILVAQLSEKLHFSELKCYNHATEDFFAKYLKTECCLPWSGRVSTRYDLENTLQSKLVGQEVVKNLLLDNFNTSTTTEKIKLFFGPPGIGKKYVAKILTQLFLGRHGHRSANFIRIDLENSDVDSFDSTLEIFASAYARCPYQLLLLENGQNLITAHAPYLQKFASFYPKCMIIILFNAADEESSSILTASAVELFKHQSDANHLQSQTGLLKRYIRAKLYQNPDLPYYRTDALLDNLDIYPFLPLRTTDLRKVQKVHNIEVSLETPEGTFLDPKLLASMLPPVFDD